MKDPTRIPNLMNQLREVWEGQPDLNFAALWGVIANHGGISWSTEDETLSQVLTDLAFRYPARLSSMPEGFYAVLNTVSPSRRITLTSTRVVVRDSRGGVLPGSWRYNRIKRASVSAPLVLASEGDARQHLGVVSGIEVHRLPARASEASVWGAVMEGEDTATLLIVDAQAHFYIRHRRRVEEFSLPLADLEPVEVGLEHAQGRGVACEVFVVEP